jgi:hypothetical protein
MLMIFQGWPPNLGNSFEVEDAIDEVSSDDVCAPVDKSGSGETV